MFREKEKVQNKIIYTGLKVLNVDYNIYEDGGK